MAFYDLSKQERAAFVITIQDNLLTDLETNRKNKTLAYFGDEDTYIRKSAYLAMGRLYFLKPALSSSILGLLDDLIDAEDFKVRQTVINAAGEIGKKEFEVVRPLFEKGLFDTHHSPRNAVIGSIKKMAEVNPIPLLNWAQKYLHHPDQEIRREICHGIELRGRKHPEDILPLLKELQHDKKARVRKNLVHVLGQIAYKKGCLETVIDHLKTWENKELIEDALEEIIDVHERYKDFSFYTAEQARQCIAEHI
jgi:HEAT repeat protein